MKKWTVMWLIIQCGTLDSQIFHGKKYAVINGEKWYEAVVWGWLKKCHWWDSYTKTKICSHSSIGANLDNSRMNRYLFHNGNWTEWSAIWSEIIRMILKLNERAVQVWFQITSMIFHAKIARREVQLPFYYICFEIAVFSCSNTSFFLVCIIYYWSSIELVC